MGYKSRNLYAQGQNVPEEVWEYIFKGESNEFKIGCNIETSISGIDISGKNTESKKTQTNGSGNYSVQ